VIVRRLVVVALLSSSSARAEHDHAVHHEHGDDNAFGASVSLLAASFENNLYIGNYQGIAPSLSWSNGRFSAGATGAMYRLEKNGASLYGLGDLVVHGQVVVLRGEHAQGGVVAAVSAPLGDPSRGLSMGHVMVMPALFGTWHLDRVVLSATGGYGRAIGGDSEHDHGVMWPLVDPMNFSEVTWSVGGEVEITPRVRGGARVSGGIPIGDGEFRVVGALRAAWLRGPFTTAAELQGGIAGDPFTLRGVVSTAISF
jgi:hypothetical protein